MTIKQCPLCGGNPFVLKIGDATHIQCVKNDHTVVVNAKNVKEASRIWNRRVSGEDTN